MSTPGDMLRPVGMLEKLYTARQVLNIYHSVIVTATYTLGSSLDNNALYALFFATIPELLHRHPSLCCYVEGGDTSKPQFRRLKSIEVKDVLQIRSLEEHESFAEILQYLHDQQWSFQQKPLWKLVVLREGHDVEETSNPIKLHLAFVYHHVIGDGLSGTAFHRSLQSTLSEIESSNQELEEAPEMIDTPVLIELSDPIEKLTSLPLSWMFLGKQVLDEYVPQWLTGAPLPVWAGLPTQTLDTCPFRSRNRVVTIQADEVGILLEESRKHGVSLTSLLTASIVSTLANSLPGAPNFRGSTTYTLRRVTGTSMDEMVNQSTALMTSYPAEFLNRVRKPSNATARAESLWVSAAILHRQLQAEIASCPGNNLVGLLPYVIDHVEFYRKKFGKAREVTWELSNLGGFKTDQEALSKNWRLQSMTFTQGAQPVGPAFCVNCVSVQDGPLTIALTWQESIVDQSTIDALAQGFTDLPSLLRQ